MKVDEVVLTINWGMAVIQLSKKLTEPVDTQVGKKIVIELPRPGARLRLTITKSLPRKVGGELCIDMVEAVDWVKVTEAAFPDIGFTETVEHLESQGWTRRPGYINPD